MRNRILMMALATAGMTVGYATPAAAQATRTWVSGVGDDVNPCSRTAPCKTFAGAISKTAAGGEINCLDPGGYGAVTIIKSMTISCPYTEGGALAGGNGITVNLPAATDTVFLRGLDIFGVNPPSNGVRFIGQGTLHIEDSTIRRFNAANSLGVSVAPTGAAKLFITRTTIASNGNGATGGGIEIRPGVGGSVAAVLTDVRIENNANAGVRLDSTNGVVTAVIEGSSISGNATGVALSATQVINGMLIDSIVANNTSFGILGSGASGIMRVGNTTITGNGTGVTAAGGSLIQTYGNNRLVQNPSATNASNGAFAGAAPPPL
ncbi:MAG: right-handed parallel beta-helix repeat-containing protein [Allosphingosinicella sp.]